MNQQISSYDKFITENYNKENDYTFTDHIEHGIKNLLFNKLNIKIFDLKYTYLIMKI